MVNDAEKGPFSPADFNFGQLPDSSLEIRRLWHVIQKVLKASIKLSEAGGYEGNWRDLVVNPLLEFAIEHFGLEEKIIASNVYVIINQGCRDTDVLLANVRYRDMVRIDPLDLLPRDVANQNESVQIKKIDTILALELPTDRADRAFVKWPETYRTFMQSTMNLHCRSPIIVNIEVKAANGIDPLEQLGIWSAAGFQKRLIDGDEQEGILRIPMPGLAIVGDRWDLHIAYRHPEGRVVRLPLS